MSTTVGPAAGVHPLRLVDLDVQHQSVARRHREHLVRDEGEDVHPVVGGHGVGSRAPHRRSAGPPGAGDDDAPGRGGGQPEAGGGCCAEALVAGRAAVSVLRVHHAPSR
ncbi:hypothetical protein ON003_05810 [Janibacter hoylei]|uniref:hypothetical protein n=1 Tax=Janibacter hoylei TaxID=364298 RepID=UPI002238EFCB|nr:hypothetical protein [Janibacter hoylei]MCW4601164.1 hypothetical protein [Janibacter hoylei]